MRLRTHVEFTSSHFPPYPDEEEGINPGLFGKRLAEFFAKELPQHGFVVSSIYSEDWGWAVELKNDAFPLWIGCGSYAELPNGFLCFIEPSRPFVRRWFSKIDTRETVSKLAQAMDAVLKSGNASNLRWLDGDEFDRNSKG